MSLKKRAEVVQQFHYDPEACNPVYLAKLVERHMLVTCLLMSSVWLLLTGTAMCQHTVAALSDADLSAGQPLG